MRQFEQLSALTPKWDGETNSHLRADVGGSLRILDRAFAADAERSRGFRDGHVERFEAEHS